MPLREAGAALASVHAAKESVSPLLMPVLDGPEGDWRQGRLLPLNGGPLP